MRRTGKATLLGASAMVAVLVASGCDRTSTAPPDPPSRESTTRPSPRQDGSTQPTAAQVFRRGHLKSYASRDGVETLTVWELCATRCRLTWVLSGAASEAVVGDAGVGAIPTIDASRNGYVVKAFGRPGFVVRPDGTSLPLQESPTPQNINAGTVILGLDPGRTQLTAVNPADGTTWELPAHPENTSIYETVVSGGGTVWAIPNKQGGADLRLLRLRAGRWRSIPMSGLYPADTTQQGIVTTSRAPTRIAIAATYGNAVTPPVVVLVSIDAGQNWHRFIGRGLPFAPGDSMAVAGDTLYLSEAGGQVWRTVDPRWDRLERVPGLHGVIGVQPAGDRVIAWRWRRDELVSIDPTGRVHTIAFKERDPKA